MAPANLLRGRVRAREDPSSDDEESIATDSTPLDSSLVAAEDDAGVETSSEESQVLGLKENLFRHRLRNFG